MAVPPAASATVAVQLVPEFTATEGGGQFSVVEVERFALTVKVVVTTVFPPEQTPAFFVLHTVTVHVPAALTVRLSVYVPPGDVWLAKRVSWTSVELGSV